tara:strand:+ start:1839 stop:3224 length:1386 start_codon:yes stop_codon:yes gene_type:complete
MGLFSELKKTVKKVTKPIRKAISQVAKGVKKAVKKVGKFVERTGKKVFKGIKELTRNKYVRLGLMITAAVMLPGAIAALPAIKGLGVTAAAVASGAISGAVIGAGGVVLAGGSLKDALKAGAFGAATGAAFAKIGQSIKSARALKEAEGAMTGDVFGGAVEAGNANIALPSDGVSTTGDVALGTGEISTAITSPQDVSAAIADSGLAAKPIGNLTDMSPLGSPDTIFVDEIGAAFAKTGEGLQPISSLNSYAVPDLNVGTPSVTDFTADISNLQPKFDLTLGNQGLPVRPEGLGMPDPLSLGDPTAGLQQNLANVSPGFKPDTSMLKDQLAIDFSNPDVGLRNVAITKPMSYGEKLAQNIKDSFSADKVVDGVLSFGGGMASSLAMSALQPDPEEVLQPGIPANALVGVGAGMASQGVQAPVIGADINPLAPYQSLTYGSGDANIMGGELFRQQILPIQVG